MAHTIIICMGSACFAQGGDAVLAETEDFIAKHGLNVSVKLQGCRCTENCSKGPVITVDDTLYTGITEEKVVPLLKQLLLDNNEQMQNQLLAG